MVVILLIIIACCLLFGADATKSGLNGCLTVVLASGDRDHILSGVFNQFLSEKSEPAE